MTSVQWLSPDDSPEALPPPDNALRHPNGLLAAGGSLRPEWLLHSYSKGIFPWYEHGQPILWWSPDPRCVLSPAGIHISRSLRKSLRDPRISVTCDRDFTGVLTGCASPRRYTSQTWITSDMAQAYTRLHELGWAHSVEVWRDGDLAGGLYGVAIGRIFFGESMFHRRPDASKIALASLARHLRELDFELIDCQLPSPHLATLGATEMPRNEFLIRCAQLTAANDARGSWSETFDSSRNE